MTLPSRDEIINGFHSLYIINIGKASRDRGGSPHNGLSVDDLKPVFNKTVADYFEELLRKYSR